jgi:hypothetical protein
MQCTVRYCRLIVFDTGWKGCKTPYFVKTHTAETQ